MSEKFRVGVVGVRAVGQEMVRILLQRKFPMSSLRVFATREREVKIDDKTYQVEKISEEVFKDIDVAFFAGGDKAEGHFGWPAVRQGAIVIDNANAFRMYPNVPLVVPEVNPEALRSHEGLIASPNCSTTQLVVALKPLHDAARIKRVVVSTYQSVSGRGTSSQGSEPVATLCDEMADMSARLKSAADQVSEGEKLNAMLRTSEQTGEPADPTLFPHPIASNCIPHIDAFVDLDYTKEEWKMVHETRKIMGDDTIQLSPTCVRVPVFNSHAESVNVEFHSPLSAANAKAILAEAPGVTLIDDPANTAYPLQLDASGKDDTFVGRVREDRSVPYGLNMWVVSDNLRKGAALNTIQIAEKMLEMGLLKSKA